MYNKTTAIVMLALQKMNYVKAINGAIVLKGY
jgi:hypothetical protein